MCDNSLILVHDEFNTPSGARSVCATNNDIVAQSVSSENNFFTSQLNITATSALNGRTVECDGGDSVAVGNHTLTVACKRCYDI